MDTSESSAEGLRRAGRELRDAVCLSMVPGVGPNLYRALVGRFGSPGAVLDAAPSRLRSIPRLGVELAARIATARASCDVDGELAHCRSLGVEVVLENSSLYPPSLRTTPSPPSLLYVRGELLPRDALSIAVVGARRCTHYGRRQAERLGASLARVGFTVISGLARGIDAAAHRGALSAGGRTIAVLAGGIGRIYPAEHRELAERIVDSGAIVCETPTRFPPTGTLFPQRNRIISGMSLGVLVVEAGQRSGALITARHAMEQNREVFAVPGPIDSHVSRGCHQLLRDGARLVESADDVLDALGPLIDAVPLGGDSTVRHPLELTLNRQERTLLDMIGTESISADELVSRAGLPAHQVLATVSVLEVRRLVVRLPGNLYARR